MLKRINKLETFLDRIKKDRNSNVEPVVVIERKKVNRKSYHMLSEKLGEERERILSRNHFEEVFENIGKIKGEIK